MKYLVRFITRNAAGGVEHNDRIVDALTITIGRATDQTLHLRDKRVRLQHATIESQAGTVHITTSALSGVTVNGRSQRDTRLVVGDVIEIGSNILRVIEPDDGIDFAITFELSEDASSEHFVADWSSPVSGIGGWSKRRLSWAFAIVVLLMALVLPGLSLLHPGIASVMRGSVLPDDSLWLAGPVHAAHASIAKDCGTCHVDLFQRVPDSACLDCHAVDRHTATPSANVLGEIRCATCHLEHNEPPGLVKQHQGLCADCHSELPNDIALETVTDFLDAHPDFSAKQEADHANLRFDHAVHVNEAGIVTPDGRRVIECAECHVPESGGARMLPISMNEHCSSCHTLAFDPDDPSREVPHGDPAAVIQTLVEYYSARLLGANPDAVEQRVRRPGRALSREDRDRAATEARAQAMKVAEDLFERRACSNCHEVTKLDSDAEVPWQVLPVHLTESFFPRARFSHAAHQTEVTSCDGCHSASSSSTAEDVLIPGIDTCRDCHGSGFTSRNDDAQTPSTCILCHEFHFNAKGSYP